MIYSIVPGANEHLVVNTLTNMVHSGWVKYSDARETMNRLNKIHKINNPQDYIVVAYNKECEFYTNRTCNTVAEATEVIKEFTNAGYVAMIKSKE